MTNNNPNTWTDNAMEVGVADANPDIANENLQYLKHEIDNIVPVPRNYIDGLVLANNSTDSEHDIDISAGVCADSTNAGYLQLTSSLTKQIDASFSEGTNQGGRCSGVNLTSDTTYYVFAIKNDDGDIDVCFDTSITCTHIPTDFNKYRRIGSIITDVDSDIIQFKTIGTGNQRDIRWTPAILDDSVAGSGGAGTTTVTLTVPPIEGMEALINFSYNGDSTNIKCYLTDLYLNSVIYPHYYSAYQLAGAIVTPIYTNSSGQMQIYQSAAFATTRGRKLQTMGYKEIL